MVKVSFFKKDGYIVKFEMKGHAEFSEENDIVCAALSAVAYSTINGIENVLNIPCGYETDDDGYLFFVLPDDLDDESLKKASILLDTMYLFISDLHKQHPDNVAILEPEV